MNKSEANRINGKKGGRPKGAKSPTTLEKEAILKAFRERAMRHADILFDAQITLAKGQTFLYKIEKEKITGPRGGVSYRPKRPQLVTNQLEIEQYLEGLIDEGDIEDDQDRESTYYFITAKEPNNQAIDSLLDRTFDKPKQQTDLTTNGKDILISFDPSFEK